MKNRIITISREFGSGGRTVGKELSKRLDIPYYDAEIIQMTAAESGMTQEYIRLQDEMTPHGEPAGQFLSGTRPVRHDSPGPSLADPAKGSFFDLANRSDCIIIGRCADYLLFHLHHCLRVFIHGDFDDRMERILKVYGESAESPKKRLLDKDFRRKAYYEF